MFEKFRRFNKYLMPAKTQDRIACQEKLNCFTSPLAVVHAASRDFSGLNWNVCLARLSSNQNYVRFRCNDCEGTKSSVIVNKNLLTSAKSSKRARQMRTYIQGARYVRTYAQFAMEYEAILCQSFVNYPVKIRTLGHPSNTMVWQMFH